MSPTPREIAALYIEAGIDSTPITSPTSGAKDAGKQPKLPSWQKRRLTVKEYLEHSTPEDNLGVITGHHSGVICVDCDKKSGGLEWLRDNDLRLGNPLREQTPGGGVHLYYRYPEHRDFVPSRLRLFDGVDFLADGGKQVVTWPSVSKDGRPYTFHNGLNLLDLEFEADFLPSWLLEATDRAHEASRSTENSAGSTTVDDPLELQRARDALARMPAAVEGQAGDHQTLKAAFVCRDFGLSPKSAYGLLLMEYNPRCRPQWSPEDLKAKVRNAYRYAKRPVGSKTVEAMFQDTPEVKEAPEAAEEGKGARGAYDLKHPIVSARAYIARHEGRVLCDQSQIYLYDPSARHWQMPDDERFESNVLRDIDSESPSKAMKLKMDQLRNIRVGIKRELEGRHPPLRPDAWLNGRDGDYVALQNGILDIRTGQLEPHDPAWFSFTTLPFAYTPTADCPTFRSFLHSVWDGDRELERALQLWLGYILVRPMSQQKFAVLIGESRAGKSTLARVMEGLVGRENVVGCDMMQFGDSFGLEPVIGKKLCVFSDIEKASGKEVLIATERIKRITGSDPITVNRKNKGMMDVIFGAKIVLVCNSIPPFINSQNALTNRMIVFPFTKSFFGKEDLHLEEKLRVEMPGIFNWALEGARDLLQGTKLLQSQAGARKVTEIAEVLDNVRGFISDVVVFSAQDGEQGPFVSCKDLFEAYKLWCRDSNYMPYGKKRFFQEFRGKSDNRVTPAIKRLITGVVRGYYGLTLDSDALGGQPFDALDVLNDDLPF